MTMSVTYNPVSFSFFSAQRNIYWQVQESHHCCDHYKLKLSLNELSLVENEKCAKDTSFPALQCSALRNPYGQKPCSLQAVFPAPFTMQRTAPLPPAHRQQTEMACTLCHSYKLGLVSKIQMRTEVYKWYSMDELGVYIKWKERNMIYNNLVTFSLFAG